MYAAVFEGVLFVEGESPNCRRLRHVAVEVGGAFTHAQLKSLDDVKRALADQVRRAGGNALVDFKYGQRSVGFWRSLLHLDDVAWYGSGDAAVVGEPSTK
jgi:hypothetical protein